MFTKIYSLPKELQIVVDDVPNRIILDRLDRLIRDNALPHEVHVQINRVDCGPEAAKITLCSKTAEADSDRQRHVGSFERSIRGLENMAVSNAWNQTQPAHLRRESKTNRVLRLRVICLTNQCQASGRRVCVHSLQ